jgi:tRNA G18 (ribose-2'-O)-methylase SpoU
LAGPVTDIIAIDDPDDPRVATYRDIRERDLVGRKGLFVAEGAVVLNVLLSARARHRPLSLLIDAKRVAALADLLVRVPEGVPVYAAAQPVIDAITGFNIHRGVLAIGQRSPMPTAEALLAGLAPRALVVVLSAIANHDNMGGLCRNAAAFGVDAVILDGD